MKLVTFGNETTSSSGAYAENKELVKKVAIAGGIGVGVLAVGSAAAVGLLAYLLLRGKRR